MAMSLAFGNRWQRKSPRDLSLGIGVIVLWTVLAALLAACPRESLAAVLDWLHRYRLIACALAAWFAAVLVTGNRASKRTESLRSWLAALPVPPLIARWESFCMGIAPAILFICHVTLAFGAVLPLAAFDRSIARGALFSTWLAIMGAVIAGALFGTVLPPPKAEDLPPGSRYVPHRRVFGTVLPKPSLSALGIWPVRRMFAAARPKYVARATMAVLLLMPLGTLAYAAMLVVGLAAVGGGVVVLIFAIVDVSRATSRWLQPLPLRSAALARHVLSRPLAAIMGAAPVLAWLFWLLGAPPGQALRRAVYWMAAGALLAACAGGVAIYRTNAARW
jgi:hypothetical protein